MERNNGLRKLLGYSKVYQTFQTIVGSRKALRWLCDHHWKIEPGMTVVDVGCGPARLRQEFPEDIQYFGFDPNEDYIAKATKQGCGEFFVGVMPEFLETYQNKLEGKVDAVVCSGVLHHLTTEQMNEVLSGAKAMLKKGGRFAALEPAWLARQDRLSRWVLSQDRGVNIMQDFEWKEAIESYFPRSEVKVVNRLVRIPYMYALLTGWKTTPK